MRLKLEQDSPQWHDWRKTGIGASEASTVLGCNPYKTRHAYWLQATGRVESTKASPAMLRGKRLEEQARRHYIAKTGRGSNPACFQHDEYPWMLASLDGINLDGSHISEFKVPMEYNYIRIVQKNEIPESWIMQVQWQMLVSGALTGEISVYNDARGISVEFPVERNEALHRTMIKKSKELWDCIQSDEPPELTDQDLEHKCCAWDARYRQLSELIKPLQEELAELKERYVATANGTDMRTDAVTVKRSQRSTVNWKAYVEALDPELSRVEEFTQDPKDIWTIRGVR